jgi:histidinol-phosphatase (PHP family)
MHTPLCQHAQGHPREYVQAGIAAGLGEIGFADHNPMPDQFDSWRMGPHQLPEYIALIEETRREFPKFPIRLGLECDFIPGYEKHLEWLAGQAPWDYLIGSVHYLAPGWDVDNPKHIKKFDELGAEAIWTMYFKNYTLMAQSGLFDFLGHPDLPKKFGYRPEGDLRRFYRESLDAIADNGIALELNTAGLRKEVKEIYPSKQFLEMASQRGIPILINSDAHAPEEVAFGYKEAVALAKEAGYTQVTRFHDRQPVTTPLT